MRSSTGKEWEPVGSPAETVQRLLDLEAQGQTLAGLVAGLQTAPATSADQILRAMCGVTYADFVQMGFTFEDVVEVVTEIYRAVGFTARPRASRKRTAES
jgi:hypothetical protein